MFLRRSEFYMSSHAFLLIFWGFSGYFSTFSYMWNYFLLFLGGSGGEASGNFLRFSVFWRGRVQGAKPTEIFWDFSVFWRGRGGATENFSWFFSDFWCLKKIEVDQKKFFSWRHFITALYTFLEKSSSFKFLSILEEKCVAHINIGTFKRKFLLTNVSKNGRWVNYTFLQKLSSFKFLSILEENGVAHIKNGRIKCELLLTIAANVVFWVGYTFLQKLNSFKFLNILEENCVAHINNGAIKCKTFVDNCCKSCLLSGLYFPTKAKFFQVSQHFRRKLCCPHQ